MTRMAHPLLPVLIVDDDTAALRGNERILLSVGINNSNLRPIFASDIYIMKFSFKRRINTISNNNIMT